MLSQLVVFGLLCSLAAAAPTPDIYPGYDYKGPAVPVGDPVNQSPTDNTKGYPRLYEKPAVRPLPGVTVTNNINVISTAFFPGGINIHFQTPFDIGGEACVNWGTDRNDLSTNTKGYTRWYDRTPPCSFMPVTQCSQYFHEVEIYNLQPGTTYYYQIPGGNGTTPSDVLSFTTARAAGDATPFSVAVLNDMGYTNARGTHEQLVDAVNDGAAFIWHGGDISYADDWYEGILECELTGPDGWPVCYNGSESTLPGNSTLYPNGVDNPEYLRPLPAGEIPNQGGPLGGDISTVYESNWDLWQQWMNDITKYVPYMVDPGNHEAACAEFDGEGDVLAMYLNNNATLGTTGNSSLTYSSCPASQRNYTAYQHRFRMPGDAVGGRSNFWYSFDYGLAHFISFDGETDYYQSPEYPFVADLKGNETMPTNAETYITDSGPFGNINGSYKDKKNYEQYQWLLKDLQSVDRSKTPWIFAQSHRPMYSTEVSSYQAHMRNAFEDLFLEYGVDAYMAGHIHWYERMWPMGKNGTIDSASIIDPNTYKTNNGHSMVHLVNGQAGNIESHSTLPKTGISNVTAFLDHTHYGFSKLNVHNATHTLWEFVHGEDGAIGDWVWIVKE